MKSHSTPRHTAKVVSIETRRAPRSPRDPQPPAAPCVPPHDPAAAQQPGTTPLVVAARRLAA